jgi:uncharacterized Fe-S cluster-containing radical SAM superfamily protein
MKNYPRYIGHPNFQPFNPIELSRQTEKFVCKNGKRKYDSIHLSPNWKAGDYALKNPTDTYGACATMTGCNLRCFFCSSREHRDYPEKNGNFLTTQQAKTKIISLLNMQPRTISIHIAGGECTIARTHLLKLLRKLFSEIPNLSNPLYKFSPLPLVGILTNGILLGHDKSYVRQLSKFPNPQFFVRIGLKAGTPEGLQKRSGAIGKYYELPFKAIKHCLDYNIKTVILAMTDPKIMPKKEREILFEKLREIDSTLPFKVTEEQFYPYTDAQKRVKASGISLT